MFELIILNFSNVMRIFGCSLKAQTASNLNRIHFKRKPQNKSGCVKYYKSLFLVKKIEDWIREKKIFEV